MVAEDVIIAPIITEEASMRIQDGKYTFRVNKKATKIDIKNAVEKLFEVKVLDVNTISMRGKERRVGVHQGKTYIGKGGKEAKASKKYKDSIEGFSV